MIGNHGQICTIFVRFKGKREWRYSNISDIVGIMTKYTLLIFLVLFAGLPQVSTRVLAQTPGGSAQAYTSERNANTSSCRLSPYTISLLQTGIFPVYNNGANQNYAIGNTRIQLLNNYRFKGRDQYERDIYRQSQTISFQRVKDISGILNKLRRKKYSPDLSLTSNLRQRGEAINADKELRRYIRKKCGALFTLNSGDFYRPDPR